jgi:hypothetical protein
MSEKLTTMSNQLRRFLDVAAGEGYVFDGVDAADLYVAFFGDGVTPPQIREMESASQPGDGEAIREALATYETMRDAVGGCSDGGCIVKRPIGMHTNGGCKCHKDTMKAARMMWAGQQLANALRAAPSAGNGGAEGVSVARLLKHEATAAPSDTVSRRDVDELVSPTAVRANEVDPEVINSGLDGVKSNLDAAADADPHGGLRAEGSGLHDRQSAENNPATHDAENTAVITANSAENSQRGSQITATWSHDAGAYARCSYCGRYSDNPHSLTKDSFPCDCGKLHGWSGSFKKPGPDAKWSDAYLMPPNGKREAAR